MDSDERSGIIADDEGHADGNVTRRSLLAAAGAGVASTAGCSGISTPADVSGAASISGNVGYFRGPEQLTAESAVFLDARSREQFRQEHVYGARRVPIESVTAQTEGESGLVPSAEPLASALGSHGLTRIVMSSSTGVASGPASPGSSSY